MLSFPALVVARRTTGLTAAFSQRSYVIVTCAPSPIDRRIALGTMKLRQIRAPRPITLVSMPAADVQQLGVVEDDRVLDLGSVERDVGPDRAVRADVGVGEAGARAR